MPKTATTKAIDFSKVKDRSGQRFNKVRQPAGDYKAQVIAVMDAPTKSDNTEQWCFTIRAGSGTYPYYCKISEDQLWKIRNLLMAAGLTVPKSKVKVNPNLIVGKHIAVTLEDDEYKGKEQSNVAAAFPLSEFDGTVATDDEDDEEEDDEESTPAPKKKAKPAPVVEDDEDEEEVEEEEEEEEPPPPPRRKKRRPAPPVEEDEDELEEIDIEDV